MDTHTTPASWVEQAVMAMKKTDTYRTQLYDEDYKTLPVPVWNAQKTWLVVGAGRTGQSGGAGGTADSRPPHLVYVIEWPQTTGHWVVDNTAQRAWPTRPGLPEPAIPETNPRKGWELTVRYYEALSKALEQGAFSARTPANPPAACAAASETRAALMPAAPYKNLAPFYAAPLNDIDGWIAANCGRR